MDVDIINENLQGSGITVSSYKKNGKEHYVITKFEQDDSFSFETAVPIKYRRSNLDLSDEVEVSRYLRDIKKYFTKEAINTWYSTELQNISGKDGVKYSFLRILLRSEGKRLLSSDFPQNPNAQKIIQGWRDVGYIISTIHGSRETNNQTPHWLLPLPKIGTTIYETMSPKFVKRVLSVLGQINVFEARKVSGALPDHKFSEIRWDSQTPEINREDMSEEEIKKKFQILDTQRNQQKREVCRHCYETGERGTIYGIKFFYKGGELWDENIPKRGKAAEAGCVGCPWYDIDKWRQELIKRLQDG